MSGSALGRRFSVKRKSILSMTPANARKFLLKGESYCNFELPSYFVFDGLLKQISKYLAGKDIASMQASSPRDCDGVNHIILNNKDGRFAWRPMQLIHPALYVALVHKLTEPARWNEIVSQFTLFSSNPKICCLSIPVESKSSRQDKAEQILQWWEEIEQRSIELSLEYEFIAHTDITDCYGSIYTHSVAWALHKRSVMKRKDNRNDAKFLGNVLDWHLQDMNRGQTNGIPQGSVLMDFVAEIVLGYADVILSNKLKRRKINEYQILRYRDDYRIFTNNSIQGEEILKAISETMYLLGMRLHPAKTKFSGDVICNSIKPDKIDWISRKQFESELQKQLIIIHNFARGHSNSGSLARSLSEFQRRLFSRKDVLNNVRPMIALTVDIAVNNPRTYAISAGIISRLVRDLDGKDRSVVLRKIKSRFERVPNTGHLQVWLQRFSCHYDKALAYSEPLCKLVDGSDPVVWNSSWLNSKRLKTILASSSILNKKKLKKLGPVIKPEEVELFESHSL